MSSYEDRMSEKYGFFSDNKKTVEEQQNLEENKSPENFEQDKSENNENNLIVPLEAWQTVLNQLGNLHEANQLMAEARERAAKSEAEAEFLREKLKNTREQLEESQKRKRFFFF
ncbi:MAG: hypothetical protein HKN86_00195 [Acidimicrobiia bacterium]|jgi:hypothetical protein|nr:hypothetical protein [Acidimicrobiia bacterium]